MSERESMRCAKVRDRLLELEAGALPPPLAERMETHVHGCTECSAAKERMLRLEERLRLAPGEATPCRSTTDSWRAVAARLPERPQCRPRLSGGTGAAGAALAAAVAGAILFLATRTPTTTEITPRVTRASAPARILDASDAGLESTTDASRPTPVAVPRAPQLASRPLEPTMPDRRVPVPSSLARLAFQNAAGGMAVTPPVSVPTDQRPLVTVSHSPSPGMWRQTTFYEGVKITVEAPVQRASEPSPRDGGEALAMPLVHSAFPGKQLGTQEPQPGVIRSAPTGDGAVSSDPFLFAATVVRSEAPPESAYRGQSETEEDTVEDESVPQTDETSASNEPAEPRKEC